VLAVTMIAGVLAVAVDLDPTSVLLVLGAVLTGQLSIGWSNDLIDLDRDRQAHRTDKPLATGELSPGLVRWCCGLAVAVCVVLSLALGWAAGLAHLLGIACGWAYNLGLKATVWSWLPYAVAFGSLAAVPSLAAGDTVTLWLPAAGALLGVGAHLVNVLPDLDDDAATGVEGLPHLLARRLGRAYVAPAAAVLFLGATALVLVAAPLGVLTWVGAAVVTVLAALTVLGHGRTPFRAAMAIALVDVVLLALTVG
jgi:4-hydroxybenzoate polyprenyltransferase